MQKVFHVALSLALGALAGCGARTSPNEGGGPSSGDAAELVILVGNSFIPPTERLLEEFTTATGIHATYTTGGSEDLLPHVEAKRQGDVFITHDPYLDSTREHGAYSDHVSVGFVAPVLAVQKGNPKNLSGIEDLTQPGLKVALSDPAYSTCGEMVFALLQKKGIHDAVMKNVENRLTKGHSNLGNLVKTRVVDAVIMWNGVANTFKDHLDVVKTPYEYDEEVGVRVIGLNYSKQPEAVERFIAFTREKGEAIFAEHGYVK
ncbi:MAG: substrate-binding domain-containing protein [Thermoguttaceae bacterium]|jgi:molybdate transport system substrate-binding protein|nr:substrate-binding domain-containing protein [Thermoguttaceae bacterium]